MRHLKLCAQGTCPPCPAGRYATDNSSVEMIFYVQLTHLRTPYTGSMGQMLAYNSSDTLILPIGPTLSYKNSIEMKFYVQITDSHTPYTGSVKASL